MKKIKYDIEKSKGLNKFLDIFNFSKKDRIKEIKKLYEKPTKFKNSHFHSGSIIFMNHYNVKDKTLFDYNEQPLIMVLGSNSKYILGWSISHTPMKYRKIIIKYILSKNGNKKRIKKNKSILIDYKTIRKITKNLKPVIRLYIKNRVSSRGIYFPSTLINEVILVKSEKFAHATAEELWKMAVISYSKKKRK